MCFFENKRDLKVSNDSRSVERYKKGSTYPPGEGELQLYIAIAESLKEKHKRAS